MKHKPIILERLSRRDLEPICHALNDEANSPLKNELRRLVGTWQKVGDLQVMMGSDAKLDRMMREAWRFGLRPTASGGAHLELVAGEPLRFQEIASYFLRRQPQEGRALMEAHRDAILLFVQLVLNPFWKKLGGPCVRCDRYFLKQRERMPAQKCCPQKCGNIVRNAKRTRNRRRAERKNKLELAKDSVNRWVHTPTRKECVKWAARETGLDSRFFWRNRRYLRLSLLMKAKQTSSSFPHEREKV